MEPQSRKIVIFRLLSRDKLLIAPSSDLIRRNQDHHRQEEHREHQNQSSNPPQRHHRAKQRHRGNHDHHKTGQKHHKSCLKGQNKVFLGPESKQGASRQSPESSNDHHKGTADLNRDPDPKLAQNPKIPIHPKTLFIPKMTILSEKYA